jgi:hypothetical protein
MTIRIHLIIVWTLCGLGIVAPIAATVITGEPGLLLMVAVTLPIMILASLAFAHLVPAYCVKPGCHGRARPRWVRVSRFKEVLWYRCDHCHATYNGNISFTFGQQ